MANRAEIRIEGLAELRRALRKAEDTERLGEVRDALRSGARKVADDAAQRVPVGSGRARGSIRAVASGNRALVVGGRRTVAYYGWLDFGSRNPVSGNPRSAGPWKGSGRGPGRGRFIYPAIDAKTPEVVVAIAAALQGVIARG